MLKKLNNKGFTIIEVLIVLAIAGVIMLVVFLAVPALQRNSRNTQRTSDAALITSAVNECLSNKNGVVGSCNTMAALGSTLDTAKLRQLTNVTVGTAVGSSTTGDAAVIIFGQKCNPAGDGITGGTSRQFVVTFQIETTGSVTNRCIDS